MFYSSIWSIVLIMTFSKFWISTGFQINPVGYQPCQDGKVSRKMDQEHSFWQERVQVQSVDGKRTFCKFSLSIIHLWFLCGSHSPYSYLCLVRHVHVYGFDVHRYDHLGFGEFYSSLLSSKKMHQLPFPLLYILYVMCISHIKEI